MRKKILFILLCLLIPSGSWALRPSLEEPVVSRWPHPKERASYRCQVAATGKFLWETTWETTVSKTQGRTQIEILEQGHGQPWLYKEPIVWEKEMILEISPEVQVRSVKGNRWTSQGRFFSHLDLQVDPERREISYQDLGVDGSDESATIPWNPEVIPDELLFHWVRTLAFDRTPAGECLLMVSPTRRFRMRAFLRGTEEVATPAGTFACHRLELSPRLGLLTFLPLKALLPRMILWVTADFPHFWVRYEGPLGGPGSPQAVIELVDFQQEGLR